MTAMFCYQCEEAAKNVACTVRGVCGKSPEVSHLQDLLIWLLKESPFGLSEDARISTWFILETDLFVAEMLFAIHHQRKLRSRSLCRVDQGSGCATRCTAGGSTGPVWESFTERMRAEAAAGACECGCRRALRRKYLI